MARVYNPRTRRLEDNGVPVPQPAPGSTVAPDASPIDGLHSGYLASTAGARLAAAPGVFQPQTHATDVLAPTLASQGARPVAGPPAPPVPRVDLAAGPAVAQALRANAGQAQAAVGKVGNAITGSLPGDPLTNLAPLAPGSTVVVPNGNANPLKQGTVTAGANSSGGQSGIFVNGKSVTHDANGNLVAAPTTTAPLSFADQKAKILEMYPQVGVAGSDQNKQFVDAFTKGGQDQTSALDLAHSLFAPKTQAQAIAADQTAAATATNKQIAADQANRTPAQVQADNVKAASNQAQVAAAGKSVYDPDATATNAGRTVGNVVDALSPQNIGAAIDNNVITPVTSAVTNLFKGFAGEPTTTPATPVPAAPAAPVSSRMPDGTLGASTPPPGQTRSVNDGSLANLPGAVFTPNSPPDPLANLAPTPATPTPAPNPPDPEDPEARRRRLAAAATPTFMQ